jgi:hypothetical protein
VIDRDMAIINAHAVVRDMSTRFVAMPCGLEKTGWDRASLENVLLDPTDTCPL